MDKKVGIDQIVYPDLIYSENWRLTYRDCWCLLRECKANLTKPAKTDPIIIIYRTQLVGLWGWKTNNQMLIPNMAA